MSENFWHTVRDFCAGWIGGVAGLVIGHPMDTIKVRQQALGFSLWGAIKTTAKYEGMRGFYKGFWTPFLIIGPSNAIFFSFYNTSLRYLQHSNHDRLDYSNPQWPRNTAYAGMIAGFAQVLLTCPIELIKTVLQINMGEKSNLSQRTRYNTTREVIVGIYRTNGILGYYKGFVPTVWRDIPASAIYTFVYEWASHQGDDQPLWQQIGAGGMAGVASWLSTLPFDVVKSRIQSDDPHNPVYKGMMDCFYKSYKAEGLKVFAKGFWLITVRAFPVNAAILIGYEKCAQLLKVYF